VYGKGADGRWLFVALDPERDLVSWTNRDLFKSTSPKDLQPPTVRSTVSPNWFVYFNRIGLVRFDERGIGEVIIQDVTELAWSGLFESDGTVLLVRGETISALDGTGKFLWDSKSRVNSVVRVTTTGLGLVLSSRNRLDLVERSSGRPVWEQPIAFAASSRWLIDGEHLYIAAADTVRILNLRDGRLSQSNAVRFEFGEAPKDIERVGAGVLLTSGQNMLLLGPEGTVRYHRYYPPVTESGFLVSLRRPLGLAGAAAATYYNAANANRTPATQSPFVAGPQYIGGAQDAEVAAADNRFFFVHTDEPKDGKEGYSLVRIDKASGQEVDRLWFGNRNPNLYSGPPITVGRCGKG